jgi:hypothetical protein
MAEAKKPRLKRLKRAAQSNLPGFKMTERDTDIIRTVSVYQAVTTEQIRTLLFGGKQRSTQCDLRLRLLFQHGYLDRRGQATLYEENKPLIYVLTQKGIQHLAEVDGGDNSDISWHPKLNQMSQHHLQHLLQVNDVRIAIEQACDLNNYELKWLDEYTIRRHRLYDRFSVQYSNGAIRVTVLIPDGFFALDTPKLWLGCFLEVDRGTESLKTISQKLSKYLAYFVTNSYKERYGAQDAYGNEVYPCVLTVTTSPRRLQNLRSIAQKVGASQLFLFTTFIDVTPERVLSQPIWQTAASDTPICLIA